MAGTRNRSLHLFSFKGIDVFLHWSWFLIALLEIESRSRAYSSITWNVLEYLGLFVIVLLHEFGHALACRQVGGKANTILLWPLGGIAYVQPPQRPGATLWSIAAGPLVNVILVPVLWALVMMSSVLGWSRSAPDVHTFLSTLALINGVLLIFNLLPIYPLDGGQILRSVLWFLAGARPQPDGCVGYRDGRRRGVVLVLLLDALPLERSHCCFCADLLLGRATQGPGAFSSCQRPSS